ncbi:biosynthetic-type acetolactate synthase large subunit [Phosphitispora sp. TUW77]|uniref:biosynthetic-type acetolactate synthase large subunit n=1 Tax=Phosphitispora sp. TUW77 TaxID=3152361 RepID=UPI003AB8A7D3
MKMTAAEALIKCLKEQGVDVVFGYPGGNILPVYDAMCESSDIRHVLVRHEQGAVHAADGYARVTGKVGVCMATSGPGATNLVTGIANAYMDSIPMVVITGQVSTTMVGTDAFQEVDITGITIPITKHNYLVKDAGKLPLIVKQAFHIAATGRPGPVLIDIPKNVLQEEIIYEDIDDLKMMGYKPTYRGNKSQINMACDLIMQAWRPLIYCGGGIHASNAADILTRLAEMISAPVTSTLMGLGAIPGSHDLSLGMLGLHGAKYANLAVTECDVLIALGVRFDDRVAVDFSSFAPNAKIIHVDIDPAEIGKNVRVDIPIVGDVRIVMDAMLERLEEKNCDEWLEQVREWKKAYPLQYKTETGLKPQAIIEAIRELTNGEAVMVTDVGQHQMWAAQYYRTKLPRTFVSSGGLGTMGYGLPAAVGAKIGLPDREVVLVTGDGSFQMCMQEFGTAVEQGLPIKVIILNNFSLGMVRQLQEFYCNRRYIATDFQKNPDFVKFAGVYDAPGLRISDAGQLHSVLEQALQYDGPVIVDCIIEKEENVYPMVLAGQPLSQPIEG